MPIGTPPAEINHEATRLCYGGTGYKEGNVMKFWDRYLERRRDPFRERATWTDKAIVFLTIGILIAGFLQWLALEATLSEMKRSGDAATNQLWQAIGNMNWMARVAD